MFGFGSPWFLLLLPLPIIIRHLLPPYQESRLAVRSPWFQRLGQLFKIDPAREAVVRESGWAARLLNWLAWLCVVVALARPQYFEPPIERVVPTRDILLVVDLSGSMETTDFTNAQGDTVDRLTAVKEVLDDFLTRRQGDRVGLIVFGNAPCVQVPFTQDLEACRLLLSETAPRMAGPRTAFGDAIGLGITLFERSEVEDRVMIALTDGNDTGSKVPPGEAAKIARDNDIVIHVVGVGDPAAAGEEKLDEEALQTVASTTSGSYYFAGDRQQLETIYDELDRIDTREIQTQSYRPRIDLYYVPLALFALASLMFYGFRFFNTGNDREPGVSDG
jgi:Ca-activated chloride channel family protein